jgi:hypothetical protein
MCVKISQSAGDKVENRPAVTDKGAWVLLQEKGAVVMDGDVSASRCLQPF